MATTIERKRAAMAKARASRRRGKATRRHHPKPTAAIEPQNTYPLELIPSLFGISRHTLRRAQDNGLSTMKLGSRKFVDGKVLIDYLRKHPA